MSGTGVRAAGESSGGSANNEKNIWKKYKTKEDITITGIGTTANEAKRNFYQQASDVNLTGPGKAEFTGEHQDGDVTNMTKQNPPFITSEQGTEAAPTAVQQPNGSWKSERTIPKGTKFLEWYYLAS